MAEATQGFYNRLFDFLIKQGAVFVVMGVGLYVQYRWISEINQQTKISLEETRKEVNECNRYSRTVLQETVEENTLIISKFYERLERIEEAEKK